MPDRYPPLAYCVSCGRDFPSESLFDRHRVGIHEYTFAEGLRLDPPVEDGRRCLDAAEMCALGWRPFTDEEMAASERDAHRVGFGVELWHDPVALEQARANFAALKARDNTP